jgi:hypothetical protein
MSAVPEGLFRENNNEIRGRYKNRMKRQRGNYSEIKTTHKLHISTWTLS